jgi:hypothetical protein
MRRSPSRPPRSPSASAAGRAADCTCQARLSPLAINPREAGGAVVELRCVRCNAAGSLLLDPESTDHRGLLTLWFDQAGRVPGIDDRTAST